MRITSTILLAFMLIIFSFPIIAQKNPAKGLIITHNSDTIVGFINDKNWDKNPTFIQFKQQEGETFKNYLPSQIKAFHLFSGERYESHIVAIDKSASKLASMKNYPNSLMEMDTVFLTVCVKGKANLYYLKDEQAKVHFFIQKDKSSIEELILLKYLQESKEGSRGKALAVVKKYKGQLDAYFSDCPEIKSSIQSANYTHESLQNLFIMYNHCLERENITYSAFIEKVRIKAALLVGGSNTELQFEGNNHKELTGAPFKKSISYTLGAGFEIILPRNRQKWSIYNEFRWKPYQVSSVYKDFKSDQYYIISTMSFDLGYINWASMVRYRYPIGKLRPFINAGVLNALAVKVGNEKIVESHLYTDQRIENKKAIEYFRKREFGFVFGVGAVMSHFSGEFRYELADGMSSYQNLKSTSKSFNFLLGYTF